MMNFEEFTENILQEIRVKAEGVFQIRNRDVVRNNNVKLTAIEVVKEGTDIGPCVYLDELYQKYESDVMKFDEIVDEVYGLILKCEEDTPDFDMSGFQSWESVHGDIYPKLVNAEQNKELLEKIPHRMFLDLAVVYYAVVSVHAQGEIGTALIHKEHMERWEQEEETLYQTAMENMRADGEADLTTIETIVKHILPGITFPDKARDASRDTEMYILTNRRKCFGASEILDKDTLRKIADQIGDRFIVLPSSLHETIILPPRDEAEYETLADRLREVNDTQVDVEERLSYHVYMYSRDEEMLKIVA